MLRMFHTSKIARGMVRYHHHEVNSSMPRVLITGANGQIGSELALALRNRFAVGNIISTDIRRPSDIAYERGPFQFLNVLDKAAIEKIVIDNNINWIIHLSAIMSVLGEQQPAKCIELNVNGLTNVLEVARTHGLRTFIPSTMAVFSPESGKVQTKDDTILNPTTVYGITKVFTEQLGAYHARKFNLDFRCVRYPGIISADTPPGGGTTDYAVWMFHKALEGKPYVCPVQPNEPLPMMYIPDCLEGTVDYICAPREKLTRSVYNVTGMSFTPDELYQCIRRYVPTFEMKYSTEDEVAQKIAHSWPDSMDDSNARRDFGWHAKWDLDAMTRDMLVKIAAIKNLPRPKGL